MSRIRWTADRIPSQAGRTFIVTGANSGLGYVTSRELARRGAHVIMAVRGESRGYPTNVQPIEAARVPETAQRLWQISEELTGVRFDFPVAAGVHP